MGVVAAKSEPSPLRCLTRHSHRESERRGREAKSGRRSYSGPVGGRCEWPAGRRVSREDPHRIGPRLSDPRPEPRDQGPETQAPILKASAGAAS